MPDSALSFSGYESGLASLLLFDSNFCNWLVPVWNWFLTYKGGGEVKAILLNSALNRKDKSYGWHVANNAKWLD